APYLVGGAVGAPLGAMLLTYLHPTNLRIGVGVLLVLYGLYGLMRPAFKLTRGGTVADVGVGFLNGLLGGLAGLVGIIVAIWCQLRGLGKDAQRAVFQPITLATAAISAISLAITGAVTRETITLFVLGLPPMIGGLWLGFRLYGRLDDVAFRK